MSKNSGGDGPSAEVVVLPTPTPSNPTITISLPPPAPGDEDNNAATVVEGKPAVFKLTVSRALTSDLTVNICVADGNGTGGKFAGKFLTADQIGAKTVTISAGQQTGTHRVPTVNDYVDEKHGAIIVTIEVGDGYLIGGNASASVTVRDNDKPSKPTVVRINGHLKPRSTTPVSTSDNTGNVTVRLRTNILTNAYKVRYALVSCPETGIMVATSNDTTKCTRVGSWTTVDAGSKAAGVAKTDELVFGPLASHTLYQVEVASFMAERSDWSDPVAVYPPERTPPCPAALAAQKLPQFPSTDFKPTASLHSPSAIP